MKQCDVIRFVSMTSLGSIAAPNYPTGQSKGRYRAHGFNSIPLPISSLLRPYCPNINTHQAQLRKCILGLLKSMIVVCQIIIFCQILNSFCKFLFTSKISSTSSYSISFIFVWVFTNHPIAKKMRIDSLGHFLNFWYFFQ